MAADARPMTAGVVVGVVRCLGRRDRLAVAVPVSVIVLATSTTVVGAVRLQ
jgi:hypothetical protein